MRPFAYVAHKDGKLAGVCSTLVSKASLREFFDDFSDDFTLQPTATRQEYDTLIESLKPWHNGVVGKVQVP